MILVVQWHQRTQSFDLFFVISKESSIGFETDVNAKYMVLSCFESFLRYKIISYQLPHTSILSDQPSGRKTGFLMAGKSSTIACG